MRYTLSIKGKEVASTVNPVMSIVNKNISKNCAATCQERCML